MPDDMVNLTVTPIQFKLSTVIIDAGSAACQVCGEPVQTGEVAVVNESQTAICCWGCIGEQLKNNVKAQRKPLIIRP